MLPLDENSRTDDILLGITHVVRHAADFGIDPSNIILSGDSFGSQMALSMAFTNGNLFKKISINNPPAQNVLLNLPSHQNNKYFMVSDIGSAWYWSNLINGANSQKVSHSTYAHSIPTSISGNFLQYLRPRKA